MTRVKASNGLAGNVEADRDWRRRSAVRYAEKRRTVVEVTRQGERTTVRRTPSRPKGNRHRNDWSNKVKELARARSGGMCELCQSATADHLHHRQSRRSRDHRIVNALHVCASCHGLIHAEPKRATVCGWIVHSQADPAGVPVLMLGRRCLLTDAGSLEDVAS